MRAFPLTPVRTPELVVIGGGETLTRSQCRGWRVAVKRAIDVVLSGAALAVLCVPMLAVAALVRISSAGPVLFRHGRVGRGGDEFALLKFRTMHRDSTERLMSDPELWKRYVDNDFKLPLADDPRVTRLGRMLRGTSLDELPQLINVLRGQMSLVGPRPVVARELHQRYGKLAAAYIQVRPGITGRWQTEGRESIRYPERAWLDVEYVANYRLRHDLAILRKTIPTVLARDGVL